MDKERVVIDRKRLSEIAQSIRLLKNIHPLEFCDDASFFFPPINDTSVLDFFFSSVLHQFGFWELKSNRYTYPFIRHIDGHLLKGSDYLWRVWRRAGEKFSDFYKPEVQHSISKKDFIYLLRDDKGVTDTPMLEHHFKLTRAYGNDMLKLGVSPDEIIGCLNKTKYPVKNFTKIMSRISGYKEDPYLKKLMLLIIVLKNRPENFLKIKDISHLKPIVDYHIQRSCLRTGIVVVSDSTLRMKLVKRQRIKANEELLIRSKAYKAIKLLSRLSGRGIDVIDFFFFMNRKNCPEMTKPVCETCGIYKTCARYVELFQPIFRTTFY